MRRLAPIFRALLSGAHWVGRFLLVAAAGTGLLVWAAMQAPVAVPQAVADRVAAEVARRVAPAGLASDVSGLTVDLRGNLQPTIGFDGVTLADASGATVMSADRVDVVLSRGALLDGRLRPRSLRFSGLTLALRRAEDGRISLLAGDRALVRNAPDVAAVLASVREVLARPAFASLQTVGIEDATLSFADARRGHALRSERGFLRLVRDGGDGVTLEADLGDLDGATGPSGRDRMTGGGAAVMVALPPDGGAPTATLRLRGIVPSAVAGVAGGSPLSALLSRLDAPVSLTLSGGLDDAGDVAALSGAIAIGGGRLDLPGRPAPLEIEAMRARVALSPDKELLRLTGLDLRTPVASASGRIDLRADPVHAGRTLAVAAFDRVSVSLPAHFSAPISFDGVWAEAHFDRAGTALWLDRMTLRRDGRDLRLSGVFTRGRDADQRIALDLAIDEIAPHALLALWPEALMAPTRRWIAEKVESGTLRDVRAALRHHTAGGRPEIGLSFAFDGAAIRVSPGLPPITGARGVGGLDGRGFAVAVESGQLATPAGAPVHLSHGLIRLPDIRERNGTLAVRFDAATDVDGALGLLAAPPFRPADAPATARPLIGPGEASGNVAVTAELAIPLRRTTTMRDVSYDVTGRIADLRTAALLPGKTVSADLLDVAADPAEVVIAGDAAVEGVPVTARYGRPIGPDGGADIVVTGALTDRLARLFGLALPPGTLRGAGTLRADIALSPLAPPRLDLRGDLTGLAVSLPALGLAKAASVRGGLAISGRLGTPETAGRLERITLDMPGMSLAAAATLVPGRGIEVLDIDSVRLGDWLEARGRYRPGPAARLALAGGRVDLRALPQGGGGGGPGLGGIDVALDEVRIGARLALTDVRGSLDGALQGRLSAGINGAAAADLRLARQNGGLAIHATSADAGSAIRAAGLIDSLHGGALDLRLVPDGAPAKWRGRLHIADTAMRNAPVMAELLSAVSVVGAIDQMGGRGITFSEMRADFRMDRDRIDVTAASAVGPSMGVSLDGQVDLARRRLDLRGVVSPVYFLNQAGGFMTRRGEGLLGITYTVRGAFDAPRVAVNPLSILAPGFLREIFRGAHEGRPPSPGDDD